MTLAATGLGCAVVQLDVTIVNTALNAISSALGGTHIALTIAIAMLLCACTAMLVGGSRGASVPS